MDEPTNVLLMRHAEPDWDAVAGPAWRGAAHDLAPLTPLGQRQAREAAARLADDPPVLVVSSPMTRALQTAALVAAALEVPLRVALGLREWLPDTTYQWTSVDEVLAAYAEMRDHDGVPDPGAAHRWEPLADVRRRALDALAPYRSEPGTVLAVGHEVLIQALTGQERTGYAECRPLPLTPG